MERDLNKAEADFRSLYGKCLTVVGLLVVLCMALSVVHVV